ncbi:YdcH family protein [Sphingosinicella sp. BN140058]|uniref:YdcH family protein n=1 Tax=Sphingosinicella sp. BN140058 TaxID=1892855 RepID=UPI0010114BF4|nr:YdcH family protein [Sphingosinicella sp. BN140058]QAY80500.1 DUF465 domain-containing protein [Sphingosinicella sp. BN140058]
MHSPHQASLQTRHEALDRKISAEAGRRVPDLAGIATLKKQKLRLKDQLQGH